MTLFFSTGIGEEFLPSGRWQEFLGSRNDADWKTYRRALQRFTSFFFSQKRPAVETGEPHRPGESAGDDGLTAFKGQLLAEKEKLAAETLKRLEEALGLEIQEKLELEKNSLQQLAEEAIRKKEEEYAGKLAEYRRKSRRSIKHAWRTSVSAFNYRIYPLKKKSGSRRRSGRKNSR